MNKSDKKYEECFYLLYFDIVLKLIRLEVIIKRKSFLEKKGSIFTKFLDYLFNQKCFRNRFLKVFGMLYEK